MPEHKYIQYIIHGSNVKDQLLLQLFGLGNGQIRISVKRVHMYKGVGGWLCCFYLIFLNNPMKIK